MTRWFSQVYSVYSIGWFLSYADHPVACCSSTPLFMLSTLSHFLPTYTQGVWEYTKPHIVSLSVPRVSFILFYFFLSYVLVSLRISLDSQHSFMTLPPLPYFVLVLHSTHTNYIHFPSLLLISGQCHEPPKHCILSEHLRWTIGGWLEVKCNSEVCEVAARGSAISSSEKFMIFQGLSQLKCLAMDSVRISQCT